MPNPHGLPAREVLRRFLNFAQASAPDKTVFLELGSRPEFLHRDLEVFTATFDTLEADHTGWITIDSVAAYVAPVCDPEEAPPGKRRCCIWSPGTTWEEAHGDTTPMCFNEFAGIMLVETKGMPPPQVESRCILIGLKGTLLSRTFSSVPALYRHHRTQRLVAEGKRQPAK